MNRSLILTCLILCLSSAINCYKIEKICKKDVFKYKNSKGNEFEVNTVLRLNFDMEPGNIYAHTIHYNYDTLKKHVRNNDHAIRLANTIELFNNKILEIYSDDYINNQTGFKNNIENDYKLIERYFDEITDMVEKYVIHYLPRLYITVFIKTGFGFVANLHSVRDNLIVYDPFLLIPKKIEEIQKLILEYEKRYDLKYVLEKNSRDVIKSEGIVQMIKFIFNKFDGDMEKRLKSKGTLILDILLPYYDENYNGGNETTKDCLSLDQLPKFYNKN